MDVTFTNILEGARQYFQGIPTGTNGGPNYQNPEEPKHHQDETRNHQDVQAPSTSYWPPHPPREPPRPPTRESTPQRPPSHHTETSHAQYPQMHHPEQRLTYPQGYQEQHKLQQMNPVQNQQTHQSAAKSSAFQYPRHSRDASNYQQYQPQNIHNSYYHPATSQTQSSRPQTLPQRVPTSKSIESTITYSQYNQTSRPPSSAYSYTQNRAFYPVANQIKPNDNKNQIIQNYNYAQSQSNNEMYYKTNYTPNTSVAYNQELRGLEPRYTQEIRTNSRSNHEVIKNGNVQASTSSSSSVPRSLPPTSTNYSYYQNTSTISTTTTTTASTNQTLKQSTSNNLLPQNSYQNTAKFYYNNTTQTTTQTTHTVSTESESTNAFSTKHKRESPLDLSVKTVRTMADSTLDETDHDKSKYFSLINHNQVSHNYPTYNAYTETFNRSFNQISSQPPTASVPKMDFHPNFNVSSLTNNYQNYKGGQRSKVLPSNQQALPVASTSSTYPIKGTTYRLPETSNTKNAKPGTSNLPRIDFPPPGYGHKTSALYPSHNQDIQKKRQADTAPFLISSKIPKVESWRQTIDQQIEQKLSLCKQSQQISKNSTSTSKSPMVNGSFSSVESKDSYLNMRPHYINSIPQPINNQYHITNLNNKPYIPPSSHNQYPYDHRQYAYMQNNVQQFNLANLPSKSNGGAADKRVLSLLRNSIETKGVKEAQRKMGQENCKSFENPADVQHPSTHVTAPLQPKPSFVSRQNVSPFTPNSIPDVNTAQLYSKLHVPKAVDSINYEINKNNKQLSETVLTDPQNPNADLDGLAAFLAARIRTKAELKQVSQSNNSLEQKDFIVNSEIDNQERIKTEAPIFMSKLYKDGMQQPRKRLFSRTDEDENLMTKGVPRRDKSGLRSSSETSVFDFPDSGSDGEMPVLEIQSLGAMRRDRKSSIKTVGENPKENIEIQSPPELAPEDDIFLQTCDSFMDQLKQGIGKKRGRRKKVVEPDVLAKLESVAKGKPADEEINKIKIKEEILEINDNEKIFSEQIEIFADETKIKKEQINLDKSESDSENETIKQLSNKLKSKNKENISKEIKKETPEKNIVDLVAIVIKSPKKPTFGDGSAFYPGWEQEVYKYKKSLRMPPSLIQVTRPPQSMRLSTSLPDLDPCPNSPTSSIQTEMEDIKSKTLTKVKTEPIDSDDESSCSINLFSNKNNYDSEGSCSIKSLPNPTKDSILDRLLQKCGTKKRRKYKRKNQEEQGPKIIPKAETEMELLPTPSLEIKRNEKVIKTEAPPLGFRKSTIENFKDAFLNRASNIVGINEQFTTLVFKSRTRKETRAMKQRATIKEVFGEDRPASAPPITFVNDDVEVKIEIKEEPEDRDNNLELVDTKKTLKNKLLNRSKDKSSLLKTIVDRKVKTELLEDDSLSLDDQGPKSQSPSIASDIETKSETPSLDGEDSNGFVRKRGKISKMRRKFSSGFDYIRKKKKQIKKESGEVDTTPKRKRRENSLKASPESVQDIQKEIKTWVLNKGIGETHLHRSARLGYTDIAAYCLEKMQCSPNPKDNAGYTPLHEACSKGHLDIAKLLLLFGANVSDSAKGGIRPLHEAVENGFVEIVRLLLSYGADPKLATYAGLTPLSLANDDATIEILTNHLNDIEGKLEIPWIFAGPASCFDPKENGYDVLASPPTADPLSDEEDIDIEVSEALLPNLYTLRGEAQNDRWVLLQDLSNFLKIKSREALLKQLCPPPAAGVPANYKSVLRELKMADFMEQAHCCQFLNASEKINGRASKIALVKYTDKVKQLLNVEEITITAR